MSFILNPKKDLHHTTAEWYTQYLLSPRWVTFRNRLVRSRGNMCQRCKAVPHVSLHHKTYARLFRESPKDVEFLCKECHFKAHQEDDIPYLYLIYKEEIVNVKYALEITKTAPYIYKPYKRINLTKEQRQRTKPTNELQTEQRRTS